MKILVVDDEHGLGSMMCRTLRALGHEAILALHPEDALELVDPTVDAVISDIDMPGMNGLELANAIRARKEDMPIAFCTGSDPGPDSLARATTYGKVLFKPWTMDDIHALMANLERRTQPRKRPLDEFAHGTGTAPSVGPAQKDIEPEDRRVIRMAIHTWEQVQRLCARQRRGSVYISLRVPGLREHQAITLRFVLPDGFAVALAAEVKWPFPDADESKPEFTVELVGLTSSLAARLRALATTALENAADTADTDSPESWESWEGKLARGSQRMKVSELLLSNRRLKAQIEGLARKMRPRRGSKS